jgi:hypothetical protein
MSNVLLVFEYLAAINAANCPDGIELQVNEVIGPGEVGLFICSVNGGDLRWTVGELQFTFPGGNALGTVQNNSLQPTLNSVSISALIARVIMSGSIVEGNRTSVLKYVPEPGFTGQVAVECDGQTIGVCSEIVSVGETTSIFFAHRCLLIILVTCMTRKGASAL